MNFCLFWYNKFFFIVIQVKKYEVQFHLCMERMVQNAEIEIQIITELESYKNKKGRFGVRTALLGLKTLQPSKTFYSLNSMLWFPNEF